MPGHSLVFSKDRFFVLMVTFVIFTDTLYISVLYLELLLMYGTN